MPGVGWAVDFVESDHVRARVSILTINDLVSKH
jgi:hypothetical protein